MKLTGWLTLAALACAAAALAADEAPRSEAKPASPAKKQRALSVEQPIWLGDFDAMQQRRILRVLVPYSRTLFFHDKGAAHGATVQAMHELEKHLGKKFPDAHKRPFTVALIPTTRDRLIPALLKGEGDIAAGDLTITESRLAQVDFTAPTVSNVSELIVTGPGAPELKTLDDLAGKQVHARPATSYHESLVALNERFAKEGKEEIEILPLPNELEDEDKLDMINAGLIQIAVIDDWLGELWAPYLPQVKLRPDLAVRSGGQVAWAIRKDSPKLRSELDAFIAAGKKQGLDRIIAKKSAANAKKMQNATASSEMKKFDATIELFRRYAGQYHFDYLMLAAQGYQESRLDQNAKSHVGAIGIMQVMPATGKELRVGDIRQAESNVHAGSKYMAQLMERYFKDAKFDEQNRTLFAFASYNAGPGNISKMRKRAAEEGLNPDEWFNNVEHVTARRIGQEPVQYVRNIYKYYVAYKLAQQVQDGRAQAIQKVKGGAKP
jgi:membrane-bound lytic murein transglycosylase MltF